MKEIEQHKVTTENHRELSQLNLDLCLAILQKNSGKVDELLKLGADANFLFPNNPSNFQDDFDFEDIVFHKISKKSEESIIVYASVKGTEHELIFNYSEFEAILSLATINSENFNDIVMTLINYGAVIDQTAELDLITIAVTRKNDDLVYFLTEKGLDFNFKQHDNSLSAFEIAYLNGQDELVKFFISKTYNIHNFEIKNFLIEDKMINSLELLLNAGAKFNIANLLSLNNGNIKLLNIILKYQSVRDDKYNTNLFYSFLKQNKDDFFKILIEHNINYTSMFSQEIDWITKDTKVSSIMENYLSIYKITNKIISGQDLNSDEISKFSDLLSKDKNCAEIFLGKMKYEIADNGHFLYDGSDVLEDDSDITLSVKYINSKLNNFLPVNIKNKLSISLNILDQTYEKALHNLEEIIIINTENLLPVDYQTLLGNPKFVKIAELMNKQHFNGDILAYLNSGNFELINETLINKANEELKISKEEKKLVEFYHQNILAKPEFDYLHKFFNDEYAINNLTYLMQKIPGLPSTLRPIIETRNMNPDDCISNKAKLALDLLKTNPNFNEYDNTEVSGNNSNLTFPEGI